MFRAPRNSMPMVRVMLRRRATSRRLTTRPAIGVRALAQHEKDIAPQQGDMDSNWLKYAPPALAIHVKNIKSGSLPEVDYCICEQYSIRSSIPSFGDTLNKEEHLAAENLEKVTGISMAALNTIYRWTYDRIGPGWFHEVWDQFDLIMPHDCYPDTSDCLSKRKLLRLENISRGVNLFISGLGTFNINEAYDGALRRKQDDEKNQSSYEFVKWHFCSWVLLPQEIQAFGYFSEVTSDDSYHRIIHILSEGELCGNRINLIKYSHWWNNPDNANALDEIENFSLLLGKPLERIPGIGSITSWNLKNVGIITAVDLAALTTSEQSDLVPRLKNISIRQLAKLVASANEHPIEDNGDCVWPEGGAEMHPTQLLNRLRENIAIRESGPDHQFNHVATLLDPEPKVVSKQVTCAEPTWTLKILRSSHAVVNAAKALHNCAQSYISKCKRGKYILAVLEKDGTGRPKAMGGYQKNNGVWRVDQVVLNQNQTAPVDVNAIFESFAETIQKWERDSN